MKKLIAVLLSGFLLSLGLVASAGTSAQAACPYTGCVDTQTTVTTKKPVRPGSVPNFRVRVRTNGNAQPSGRITIRVERANGKYVAKRTVAYFGGSVSIKGKKLPKKGNYTVTATYKPNSDSIYKRSQGVDSFKIKR